MKVTLSILTVVAITGFALLSGSLSMPYMHVFAQGIPEEDDYYYEEAPVEPSLPEEVLSEESAQETSPPSGAESTETAGEPQEIDVPPDELSSQEREEKGAVPADPDVKPVLPDQEVPNVEALPNDYLLECGDVVQLPELQSLSESGCALNAIYLLGVAEQLVPDGDEDDDSAWNEVEAGACYPLGSTFATGNDSVLVLVLWNHTEVMIPPLSEVTITKDGLIIAKGQVRINPRASLLQCIDKALEPEPAVEQVDIRSDMSVSSPNATASPTGTDFAVAYDPDAGQSIIEVYDGSVLVTSLLTGETQTIIGANGKDIQRLEIGAEGTMVLRKAIPQNAIPLPLVSPSRMIYLYAAVVLVFAVGLGIAFIVYRNRHKQQTPNVT